jgi:chaperone LolA
VVILKFFWIIICQVVNKKSYGDRMFKSLITIISGKIILVAVVFSNLSFINAQNDSSRLLKSLQDKFETITDLSADIIQASMGQTLAGNLKFKKENNFKLELKNNIIVSNGSHIWNFNKKDKKVIISDYDESDPAGISIKKIVNDYPAKSTVSSGSDEAGDYLILTPKPNSDLNFNSVKIWINRDNLISKLVLESGSGTTEVRFANYKINQNLKDSEFTFIPPEGSTVIDLR